MMSNQLFFIFANLRCCLYQSVVVFFLLLKETKKQQPETKNQQRVVQESESTNQQYQTSGWHHQKGSLPHVVDVVQQVTGTCHPNAHCAKSNPCEAKES